MLTNPDSNPHDSSSPPETSESRNRRRARELSRLMEGRSTPEKLFYHLHGCFPENMDLAIPVVKRLTAFGLLMTVTFERVP